MADIQDWYTPARINDRDLLMAQPYCKARAGSLICTRPENHPGLHVASYGYGRVCHESWGPSVPVEMCLPEGF